MNRMKSFSERYGYRKFSDVIIREKITPEIQNAICSCYDRLQKYYSKREAYYEDKYRDLESFLWTRFLNKREGNFWIGNHYQIVATCFLEDNRNSWFRKLDLVEFTIRYLSCSKDNNAFKYFVEQLNGEFERLNFAYRVVETSIVEITSKEEIDTVESSIHDSTSNIRIHLNNALELYAQRPIGDYRNSIKESISAVEAYCREITDENSLGKALNKMNDKGLVIPRILKDAFEKLYAYTNQPDTGIRHALMDENEKYTPASEEALFMLVSCSSFINYLNKKQK